MTPSKGKKRQMNTNYQNQNSISNQNQLQNTENAAFGQATPNNENRLNLSQAILYTPALITYLLNLLISQLGFKDKDKVTLQVLFGASEGALEFSSFYQDLAKQIWEKAKFTSYYINSAIHKSTHTRMIRNRLNSIDQKQKEWQIPILDWVPGDKIENGEEIPSNFKFYLIDYMIEALELAQKESCYERDPKQAMRRAASQVVEKIAVNKKEAKGSSKKVKIGPYEKIRRHTKASIGTFNRAIKEFKGVDDSPEEISKRIDELVEAFNANALKQKSQVLEEILKEREEQANLLSKNAETENLEKDDYPSLSERVVKVETEKIFFGKEPKTEKTTTPTNKLVKNIDIANLGSKSAITKNVPEEVETQKLEIAEETIPGLKGGEGVQTCTDEDIDVEVRQETISTEKERDIEETERNFRIISLERKIESVLEIDFREEEEEQYLGQRKTSRYEPKPKALSKYSLEQCLEYAKSLKGINSPEIFAQTIWESGKRDPEVGKFVEKRKEAEQKEKEARERAEQELEESRKRLKLGLEREKVEEQMWENLSEEERQKLIEAKHLEILKGNYEYRRAFGLMPKEGKTNHLIGLVKRDFGDKWEEEQQKNSS